MSRSGYHDDLDILELGRWRGRVSSASRGKRGQVFFKDLISALDAMPVKELYSHNVSGDFLCAMGVVGEYRGVDLSKHQAELDEDFGDHVSATEETGEALNIAGCLALEVADENDLIPLEKPHRRWCRMRLWAGSQIIEPVDAAVAQERGAG